ncbi:MAG: helix-turn-helix transcriptional regulator [Rhodospirillales bacterium]|jgi:phage repressor protein C with HTH and peptisase S24 domain
MNVDPIRRRVLARIGERQSDLKEASLAIGKNAAYIHQFIYRGTPKALPEDVREALARFLEIDEAELRHQNVPPRKPRSDTEPEIPDGPRRRRGKPLVEGFSAVSEIDARASAGPGAINDGLEESKETWLFPDPVIRHEFRANPSDLHIITIDGDSMEPLLATGDRILIDTSQRVPVPPGIFVIWDGMGIVAKRVEHVPHSDPPKIVIKSVNPEYQTYERDAEEVNIIGRVIWAAKRL